MAKTAAMSEADMEAALQAGRDAVARAHQVLSVPVRLSEFLSVI
jgi:hypothetical protein